MEEAPCLALGQAQPAVGHGPHHCFSRSLCSSWPYSLLQGLCSPWPMAWEQQGRLVAAAARWPGGWKCLASHPQTPAKHLQQAGAGSSPDLVEKQPRKEDHARVSPPSVPAIWGGGPRSRGRSSTLPSNCLAGAPSTLDSPMLPPAWHGTTQRGHWVTCPGSHGRSVAEIGSINSRSLNPPSSATPAKASLAPGPKERGLEETGPLFLLWF